MIHKVKIAIKLIYGSQYVRRREQVKDFARVKFIVYRQGIC